MTCVTATREATCARKRHPASFCHFTFNLTYANEATVRMPSMPSNVGGIMLSYKELAADCVTCRYGILLTFQNVY